MPQATLESMSLQTSFARFPLPIPLWMNSSTHALELMCDPCSCCRYPRGVRVAKLSHYEGLTYLTRAHSQTFVPSSSGITLFMQRTSLVFCMLQTRLSCVARGRGPSAPLAYPDGLHPLARRCIDQNEVFVADWEAALLDLVRQSLTTSLVI